MLDVLCEDTVSGLGLGLTSAFVGLVGLFVLDLVFDDDVSVHI